MKYFILPGDIYEAAEHEDWLESSEQSLDGWFYDYLCLDGNSVLGVRYWVDESVSFNRHAVFKQFLADERFKFCQEECYVDIVFDKKDSAALHGGGLRVRTVQDIGGDSVLKSGSKFGISFSL